MRKLRRQQPRTPSSSRAPITPSLRRHMPASCWRRAGRMICGSRPSRLRSASTTRQSMSLRGPSGRVCRMRWKSTSARARAVGVSQRLPVRAPGRLPARASRAGHRIPAAAGGRDSAGAGFSGTSRRAARLTSYLGRSRRSRICLAAGGRWCPGVPLCPAGYAEPEPRRQLSPAFPPLSTPSRCRTICRARFRTAGSPCRTKLVSAASMIPYSSRVRRSGSS
jgi:hypothetical protein